MSISFFIQASIQDLCRSAKIFANSCNRVEKIIGIFWQAHLLAASVELDGSGGPEQGQTSSALPSTSGRSGPIVNHFASFKFETQNNTVFVLSSVRRKVSRRGRRLENADFGCTYQLQLVRGVGIPHNS